jgi:hypothetical protein
MKNILLAGLLVLAACGQSLDPDRPACRPQEIAIIECREEQWQNNPNTLDLKRQEHFCHQRFDLDICYVY